MCCLTIFSLPLQDYQHWELVIMGDNCPQLDDFMEGHKSMFLGGLCVFGCFYLIAELCSIIK